MFKVIIIDENKKNVVLYEGNDIELAFQALEKNIHNKGIKFFDNGKDKTLSALSTLLVLYFEVIEWE